jgi:uncharacterized repeat protein (TIGR01451 family)
MNGRYHIAVPEQLFARRALSLGRRVWLIAAGLVLTAALLIGPAGPARASGAFVTEPQLVSGPDPLPAPGELGACGSTRRHHDWESEPTLAVNPVTPNNLVTAWIQDWTDAVVVAYSKDGGSTWTNGVVPPTTICTPGGFTTYDGGAINPWLSIGASDGHSQGIAYLSTVVIAADNSRRAIIVNRSFDGGVTWLPENRRVLDNTDSPLLDLDGSYVIADPTRPGHAYATWAKADFSQTTRKQYVSQTSDGGENWSPPLPVPSSQVVGGGLLVVLGDGTLVDVFAEIPPGGIATCPPGPISLMATRSPDGGSTWLPPTPIAIAGSDTFPSAAVDLNRTSAAPDGTIYVSWKKDRSDALPEGGPSFSLMYAKSVDGGLTWQSSEIAREPGPLETGNVVFVTSPDGTVILNCPVPTAPNLAVGAGGTVGVTFYDHRNDLVANDPPQFHEPPQLTDYWLRYSRDGGASWQEQHLAGFFDHTQAPTTPTGELGRDDGGNGPGSIGGHQGIVPIAGGFATTFALAKPFVLNPCSTRLVNPKPLCNTDIFYSSIGLGEADLSLMKAGPSGRVPTGRNMTYMLTVANNGPDEASRVTVVDQLPPEVSFVSAAPGQGSCGESVGTVTCILGQMANGATATVDIVVRPTSAGTVTNTASVSAFTPDPIEINNTDSVETSICRITSRRSSIPCG